LKSEYCTNDSPEFLAIFSAISIAISSSISYPMDRISVPKSCVEGGGYFEFDGAVSLAVEDGEGGFNLIFEYNFDSL
jgi:hypothetical protein